MAYTIYEYETVTPQGVPVEPPSARTATQALGAASAALAPSTVFVAVVADADMYFRISEIGDAATAADHKILAGETRGFPVARGAAPKLYGLTSP